MRKTEKRTFWRLALVLIGSFLFVGCQHHEHSTTEKIDLLKKQVVADSILLHQIGTVDFQRLENDFKACDADLKDLLPEQVDAAFEHLYLTHAYLHQFSEVSPVMRRKFAYTIDQLDRLKHDLEIQYLSDSLTLAYLDDERKVADTLHNQVLYFKERFSNCQNELNLLKKSRK